MYTEQGFHAKGDDHVRILIADDHELFRDGLRLVLADLDDGVTVAEASTYDETLATVVDAPVDVVLLDLVMPGMPWTRGLEALSQAAPETPVVILSASDDKRLVLEAVRLGAKGFIPKTSSSKVMLSALRLVLSGGVYLPPAVLKDVPAGEAMVDTVALAGGHGVPHLPPDNGCGLAAGAGVGAGGSGGAGVSAEATTTLTPRQREVLALLGQGKSNKEIARILDLSEGTVKLHVTAILKALNVSNRTGAVVAASRLGLTDLAG